MPWFLKAAYLKLTGIAILSFAVTITMAQKPTTTQEKQTDLAAHKAINLLNAHQPDSVYQMAGEAFKQQITLALWQQLYQAQLVKLLPIKSITFKGSDNGINRYKLEASIILQLNIGLDDYGKLGNFSFTPYQEEVKAAGMTAAEKKTDAVTRQVVHYLNTKQPDSSYSYAGENFKKHVDATAWHNFNDKQLASLLPITNPVFVSSRKGINKYKIGELQLSLSLDSAGMFDVFAIEPYREDAQKTEKVATDNAMQTSLDSIMNKALSPYIQTKGNVGISAAVYYKGADHYYNYGETAQGNHTLPNAHTLYEIGSITKTFTATLLAKAVTDGLLSLDDPITKYLPDSVAANPYLKFITLKLLSNHTSGLPRMPGNFNATVTDLNQPYEHYTEAHLFAYLKSFKATRGAGMSYEYSNLAVGLLGVIMEKVYHKPYDELIKLYITQPLQLNDTKIKLTETEAKHLAQGYDARGNAVEPWKQQATKAAGALKSTAANMLQYGKLQLPQFNNPLTKAFKLTHAVTLDDGINKVGLGWHYLYKDTDPVIQHTGATGGYKSVICVNLNTGLVLVILTNNVTSGDALGLDLMAYLERALPQ